MQLVFVHIGEPFGVLENQSFPLSSELIVDFNSVNREIHIANNDQFIKGFYGDRIADVTALVGKNGVGKTTFIRFIKELFFEKRSEEIIRKHDVILMLDKGRLILYREERMAVMVSNQSKYPVEERRFRDYPKVFDFASNTTLINYSNSIDHYPDSNESASFINISTSYLLQRIGKVNGRVTNKRLRLMGTFRRHQFLELKRQIDFVRENQASIKDGFKMVDFFDISINSIRKKDFHQIRKKLHSDYRKARDRNSNGDYELADNFDNIVASIINFIEKGSGSKTIRNQSYNIRKSMIYDVGQRILVTYLTSVVSFIIQEEDDLRKVLGKFKQFLNDTLKQADYDIGETLNRSVFWVENNLLDTGSFRSRKSFEDIIISSRGYKEFFNLLVELINNSDINQSKIRINTSSKEATELLNYYFSAPIEGDIIIFHWPQLSSGEESMIAFYARFQEAVKVKSQKRRNVVLLIDEGDLYFHPEWQKKYFNNLINYLQRNHTNTDRIQLIMTTHSPFIVSDLPSYSVLFMNQTFDGVKIIPGQEFHLSTFGGSIPKIINEGFFLEDRTISEFSYNKLVELIEFLKSGDSKKMSAEEAEKLIAVVGEPILQESLRELFQQKYTRK